MLFQSFWGINEVAKDLENPFGSDANDIPLYGFHKRFCVGMQETLRALDVVHGGKVDGLDEEVSVSEGLFADVLGRPMATGSRSGSRIGTPTCPQRATSAEAATFGTPTKSTAFPSLMVAAASRTPEIPVVATVSPPLMKRATSSPK